MREVKYIVPEQVKDIHVPQNIIDKLLEDCANLSARERIVFLGNIDGYLCFSWENESYENTARYARSPIVSIVDNKGNIERVNVMVSQKILKKAKLKGIKGIMD